MPADYKSPQTALSGPDDQPVLDSQLLKNRGRTNSPPLSRAVFYNPNEKRTEVRRVTSNGQFSISDLSEASLTRTIADQDSHQKVKIPSKNRLVTIFVDPETESKPTTESAAQDGRSNVVLTQLHLDQLGLYGQILRYAGLLSTCYVTNAPPLSEVSSQTNLQDAAS